MVLDNDGWHNTTPAIPRFPTTPRTTSRDHPSQHGGIKHPPGNDTIKRQAALQALAGGQLTLFDVTATFQNTIPNLNTPAPRIPRNTLDSVVDCLHLNGAQQQPLNGLDVGWGIDFTYQQVRAKARPQTSLQTFGAWGGQSVNGQKRSAKVASRLGCGPRRGTLNQTSLTPLIPLIHCCCRQS